MPKGTFNNKLNTKHHSSFSNAELIELKGHCKKMVADLKAFINTYLEKEEFVGNPVDEVSYYNGKPLN